MQPPTRPFASAAPASPSSVTPADGHFLAGFIEAEGSFGLRPINGGQNWQCTMSLSLRDDDAELLANLAQLTGLGRLSVVPARGGSNPQVVWKVVSQADCLRLAQLLREFPLCGRKRHELEIWSEAVGDLRNESRPASLPLAHARLRALRRYVDPERRAADAIELSQGSVEPYLGGFFTGEGHLSISRRRARTVVKVREDDRPLLEALARTTGLGTVYFTPAYGNPNPAAAWIIYRADHLPRAVELLKRAGLRGRKRREFEVWREAALEAAKPAARRHPALIDGAAARVAQIRTYRAPPDLPRRRDRREEHKRAYLEVLKGAANLVDGPVTTTTYNAVRAAHAQWPTRNTIATAFGSWAAALSAAGLETRCTDHARAHAAVRRGDYSDGELLERRASRERVLETVTRLVGRRARAPTVHDYLAYRAANNRSLPSLSRLYNLFPAGWWSVLRQAGLPARPPRRA